MWRGRRDIYPFIGKFFLSELNERTSGLAQEAYSLVKHGNFSYHDVLIMSGQERSEFIDLLYEENRREKEAIQSRNLSK